MNANLATVIASASGQMGDVTMSIVLDENGQCRECYSVEGAVITIDAPLSDLGHQSSHWLAERLPLARHGLAMLMKAEMDGEEG